MRAVVIQTREKRREEKEGEEERREMERRREVKKRSVSVETPFRHFLFGVNHISEPCSKMSLLRGLMLWSDLAGGEGGPNWKAGFDFDFSSNRRGRYCYR